MGLCERRSGGDGGVEVPVIKRLLQCGTDVRRALLPGVWLTGRRGQALVNDDFSSLREQDQLFRILEVDEIVSMFHFRAVLSPMYDVPREWLSSEQLRQASTHFAARLRPHWPLQSFHGQMSRAFRMYFPSRVQSSMALELYRVCLRDRC